MKRILIITCVICAAASATLTFVPKTVAKDSAAASTNAAQQRLDAAMKREGLND